MDESEYNRITFLTEANAGASLLATEQNNFSFKLPDLFGSYSAFKVRGDSMLPTLVNNDILVCETVIEVSELIDYKIYVIDTNDGVQVKRLKLEKSNSVVCGITLISDNKNNPDSNIDFSTGIHNAPYFKIFKPVRRISQTGII